MTGDADRPAAGRSWRRLGWPLAIFALACLAIGACVATSSGLRKVQSQPRLDAAPETAVRIRAESLNFTPTAESRVELHGTTNIGPWTSQSTDVRGQVALEVDENALDALFDRIQASASNEQTDPPFALSVRGQPVVHISVPIESFHSDKPGMDRDMRDALKASQFPEIDYTFDHLRQVTAQRSSMDGRPALRLQTVGLLSLAGVGRRIEMDVIVNRASQGHFVARAQTTLLMSDFDVTPPVALFGVIRAGGRVQVNFDLRLLLTEPTTQRVKLQ